MSVGRASLRRLTAFGTLLAALGSLLYFSWINRFFELDDALIYHRSVRNFLAGEGLVYNPGERFNVLTSPLYALLLGLCLYLFESRRPFWLGVAGALLVLTRFEGIFLLAALAIEHLWQHRSLPRARHFAIPALLVGTVLLFNAIYYGDPLPHTAAAKIAQGRSGLWGD